MTKTKNIENTPANLPEWRDEPNLEAYAEGRYLQDEISRSLDDALSLTAPAGEITEDDVHEKPGAGFHDEGMYGEGERLSDGAFINEANGEHYKTDETDEDLFRQHLGHVATDVSELGQDDKDLNDATAEWLKTVGANPDAQREATAIWLEQQRKS